MVLRLALGVGCVPLAGLSAPAAAQRDTSTAPPVNTGALPIASNAVARSLLVDVHSLDTTIVVDLRYATAHNFTGAPIAGYGANRAYLRRAPAEALVRVERQLLVQGLALKIFDAYRPVRASEAMVAWTQRVGRPDLLRDGYIASHSRHNLGVTVDLTLVDRATGQQLDMGTPFDTFSPAAHTVNATGVAALNRQRLRAAMVAQGFVPYDEEWWHFTYDVPHPLRFDMPITPR
ncbi:MAG TPA: M15 family metallopeptidase [Gemmatimonadaceae bacterium]|nr:M15 family metallopeptidase [Gemmatimonadaceae bacterium]